MIFTLKIKHYKFKETRQLKNCCLDDYLVAVAHRGKACETHDRAQQMIRQHDRSTGMSASTAMTDADTSQGLILH